MVVVVAVVAVEKAVVGNVLAVVLVMELVVLACL